MSQSEDIMFCRIAISSGLVDESTAKKVLALCDKKERETGRRPIIGALFEKHNLLAKPDIQRVYLAIKKRTGGAAGAERVAAQTRKGAGGAAARRRAAPVRPRGKIDQNTLVLGVGAAVVFLGILGFMFYKLMDSNRTAQVAQGGSVDGSTGTAAGAVKPAPPPKPPEPKGPVELPKEVMNDVTLVISDVRATLTDTPQEAVKKLAAEKKKLEDRNYKVPDNLNAAIKEFEGRAKEAASAPPPAETPKEGGELTPPPAGEPAPAEPPADPPAAAEPAASSDPPAAEPAAEPEATTEK